jgi:predicted transporter
MSPQRREYLLIAAFFTLMSLLSYWFLSDASNRDKSTLVSAIMILGAVLFSVMAVVSWIAFAGNWSAEKSDRVTMRTLGAVILIPVVLILSGLALYFVGGWFAGIPSWAAIIIVLLFAILMKMR